MDEASAIVHALQPLLDEIDPSPGVRLVGVSGSNLGPPHRQLTLDDLVSEAPSRPATGDTLDLIRDRFGSDAIGPASGVRGGRLRSVKRGEQQWGPSDHGPDGTSRGSGAGADVPATD